MYNKTFYKQVKCVAPFSSIYLKDRDSDLSMTPCCAIKEEVEKITVDQNQSITENFKKFQIFRDEFIAAGHDTAKYHKCKETCINDYESSQMNSHNNTALENYSKDYLLNPAISTLHINFSNRCNLACRMCGPNSSNVIARELSGEKDKSTNYFIKKYIDTNSEFYRSLYDGVSLADLRYIWFSGGEPFLQAEMWHLLYYLDATFDASKISLQYNTNGTIKLTEDKKSLLKKFKNLQFHISMDGLDLHAEYTRTGLNWESWLENFRDLCSSFNRSVSVITTVSVLNVHLLDKIYKFFNDNFKVNVSFNYLDDPQGYCINEMPMAAKQEIMKIYKGKKEYYNVIKFMHSKETTVPSLCYTTILLKDIQAISSGIHKNYKLYYDIDRRWLEILGKGMKE